MGRKVHAGSRSITFSPRSDEGERGALVAATAVAISGRAGANAGCTFRGNAAGSASPWRHVRYKRPLAWAPVTVRTEDGRVENSEHVQMPSST